MNPEQPKQYTPEEIAKMEKGRTLSDAELLKGGAEYVVDEEGKKQLKTTVIQQEVITNHHDKYFRPKGEKPCMSIEQVGEEIKKIQKLEPVHEYAEIEYLDGDQVKVITGRLMTEYGHIKEAFSPKWVSLDDAFGDYEKVSSIYKDPNRAGVIDVSIDKIVSIKGLTWRDARRLRHKGLSFVNPTAPF